MAPRVVLCLVALGCIGGGLAGAVINIMGGKPGEVVGALVIIPVGVYFGCISWRSSLTIKGDTLTVCNGWRDRVISRDEITDIGSDSSSGVSVGYERGGSRHHITANAGQGQLNYVGSRIFHVRNRTELIAGVISQWQRTGNVPDAEEQPAG